MNNEFVISKICNIASLPCCLHGCEQFVPLQPNGLRKILFDVYARLLLLLLGLPSKKGVAGPRRSKLLNKLLLLVRKCILLNWIQENPLYVAQWWREIFRILPMERLSVQIERKRWHLLGLLGVSDKLSAQGFKCGDQLL